MELDDSAGRASRLADGGEGVSSSPLPPLVPSDPHTAVSTVPLPPCSAFGGNEDAGARAGSNAGAGLHRFAAPEPASLRAPLTAPGRGHEANPRVYQVWPQVGGHNQFNCRGRCVTGPRIDLGYNICAWSFIIAPSVFYFVVCAKYLWLHVTPLLPILTGLVLLSTVLFLLLTSCTDPGIIPRHSLQIAVAGLGQEVALATGVDPPAIDPITSAPVCQLTEEQSSLGYRWCPSCMVVRPPRSSHCRDCDNCVLRFDHHCPFVNNCVGQRNYAYFSGFLVSTGCLGFAVFAGIGVYFSHVQAHASLSRHLLYGLLATIGIPTCLLLLVVVGLGIFHMWLMCRGRTTKEALTGKVTVRGRTLFTLRGRSLIRARARVSVPMTIV